MGNIDLLFETDIVKWIYTTLVALSGFTAACVVINKFANLIGKPIKWFNRNNKDHDLLIKTSEALNTLMEKEEEDVRQSIRHDEKIREDLRILSGTVNGIAANLEDMQRKNNETKVKELKNTLINYYNKYRVIGEWSKLEKDAFWSLFEDYEARGGDGFIHTIVEPVMRNLKEVD